MANSENCPFPALQQQSVTVLDVDSNSDLTCNVYVYNHLYCMSCHPLCA